MIQQLFPIPVYAEKVSNFKQIQEELSKAINNTKFSMKKDWGATHYLSDPNFKENYLHKHKCDTLLFEISMHLQKYAQALPVSNELLVTQSWAALFTKNNYGHIHDHIGTVSGVYYYKTKGSDGHLFFASEHSYQGRVNFQAEEGMLLLFPSHLRHGITTNTTDETRISISFNLM
jgi:uncharacterized protein (TIGR02466 family)